MDRSDQKPLSGCRVLLVEDDRDTAESLRDFLTLCGFQVMVAYTCQEGLETARKLEPHIALAAGFDQHLVKPVDTRRLLGELEATS
jgi:ActR/RegA family two-component response regulator